MTIVTTRALEHATTWADDLDAPIGLAPFACCGRYVCRCALVCPTCGDAAYTAHGVCQTCGRRPPWQRREG